MIEAGAHDLGLTPQRIGVLYPIAILVRLADLAAAQELVVDGCDPGLPHLPASLGNARVEGRVGTERRIDRKGAGDDGRCKIDLRPDQAIKRQRRRDLRSVEQCQALLGGKRHGFEADTRERRGGRHRLAIHAHLAVAHENGAEVSQGGQIAGCANRSLGRNDGERIVVVEPDERLDCRSLAPGKAKGKRVDLERKNQPYDGIGQGRTGAGGMAQDDPSLQVVDAVARDRSPRETAKSGVDAVDPGVARGHIEHEPCRTLDIGPGPLVNGYGKTA